MFKYDIFNPEVYDYDAGGDGLLYICEDGIAIPNVFFDRLLNERLLENVKGAIEQQKTIFAIADRRHLTMSGQEAQHESWGAEVQYQFSKHRGLVDENGKVIDSDMGYMTIIYHDNWYIRNYEPNAKVVRHYMDKEWHDREIDKLKAAHNQALRQCEIDTVKRLGAASPTSILNDVERIIVDKVKSGVSQGIAQAIQQGTATLKEVQSEKQRLKQQLQQLEIAEQKAIARDAQKAARKANKTNNGFVYVVKQIGGEHYKIGRTGDPDDRLRTFNVKLPFPVEFEILLKCDDMYKLESELHARYADKRIRGEWFNLSTDDLEAIRGLSQ